MNQKQKDFLKTALIILFIIFVLFNVVKCIRKSTVLISNLPNKDIYFNSTGKELIVGKSKDGFSKLMQKLEPGIYILYYDENPSERWYATMRIKKGKKEVNVGFRKHRLPSTKKTLNLGDKFEDMELGNRSLRYSIYNDKNNEIFYKIEINYSLRGKRADGKYTYTAKWWLDINGSRKDKEQVTIIDGEDKVFSIYEDKLHTIEVKINTNGSTATFEMNSVLAEYSK
ncbi:hypothetical protein ACFLYJ_00415 [Candidatus Cloacimonadota bacterium]